MDAHLKEVLAENVALSLELEKIVKVREVNSAHCDHCSNVAREALPHPSSILDTLRECERVLENIISTPYGELNGYRQKNDIGIIKDMVRVVQAKIKEVM